MTQNILDDLKAALSRHDWYYNMSDDYTVYCRGQRNCETIRSLMVQAKRNGLETESTALFDHYAK